MDTRHAIETARSWIQSNLSEWPGLRAAHLVGGITALPPTAPFPPTKDVDIHLVFDEGSPALQPPGPFMAIIETAYEGILIEAGIKSVADYVSAEAVLANPEIAHHLTLDTILYDPTGFLSDLQAAVRDEFADPQWVQARIEHERRGVAEALAMRPMASAMYGASGEVNLLGYASTYVCPVIAIATLNPPKMGGRSWINLRNDLDTRNRLDLYEDLLAIMGVAGAQPDQVDCLLDQGAALFDLAVAVKRTPHPFGHKLHAHLRPYFVDSCKGMIAEGYHREALGWLTPFTLASTDVMLADGPDNQFARTVAFQEGFLRELGMESPEERSSRYLRAASLFDQTLRARRTDRRGPGQLRRRCAGEQLAVYHASFAAVGAGLALPGHA